jgi:hypothetical protein
MTENDRPKIEVRGNTATTIEVYIETLEGTARLIVAHGKISITEAGGNVVEVQP